MKGYRKFAISVVLAFSMMSMILADTTQGDVKVMNSGIEIVQEIAEGKYEEIAGKFNEQMKEAMDQERLEKT